MKHYFLTRQRAFIEVELVNQSNYQRLLKIKEGADQGKTIRTSPEGVARGRLYPRVFISDSKPTSFYEFNRRVLLKNSTQHTLVPTVDSGFRFQPFLRDIMDCVIAKENTLLTGGTGVGKTAHIVQLASQINQPLIRVNFNGETRLSDFIGKMHVVSGSTKWLDGVLPMAMREGYWLLLDEIDFADPAILSLLHPVLEDDSILVLKENNGEVIRPHPSFRIFATANSIGSMADRAGSYAGTQSMNDAFLDRWQVIKVPNLPFKDELKVVKAKTKGLKRSWARQIVEFARRVRENNFEGGINFSTDNFSTRRVLAWARKTALTSSPIEGAKVAWLDKLPASEHEATLRILQLHFGSYKKSKEPSTPELVVPKKRGRPKKV